MAEEKKNPEKSAESTPPEAVAATPTPSESAELSRRAAIAARFKEMMSLRAKAILRSSREGRVTGTLKEINSKDAPTRYMARVFLLSLVAMVLIVYGGYHLYQEAHPQPRHPEENHLAQFLKKEAEDSKFNWQELDLGDFNIEIKPDDENAKPAPGVTNIAEIQLILECDNDETRTYIVEKQTQARNEITNILTPLSRSDLLTSEGKKKLRHNLITRLNKWLPRGKIEDIYFPKLMVN